jgi:hypothetical protein
MISQSCPLIAFDWVSPGRGSHLVGRLTPANEAWQGDVVGLRYHIFAPDDFAPDPISSNLLVVGADGQFAPRSIADIGDEMDASSALKAYCDVKFRNAGATYLREVAEHKEGDWSVTITSHGILVVADNPETVDHFFQRRDDGEEPNIAELVCLFVTPRMSAHERLAAQAALAPWMTWVSSKLTDHARTTGRSISQIEITAPVF